LTKVSKQSFAQILPFIYQKLIFKFVLLSF
jgi:hypothetical protein